MGCLPSKFSFSLSDTTIACINGNQASFSLHIIIVLGKNCWLASKYWCQWWCWRNHSIKLSSFEPALLKGASKQSTLQQVASSTATTELFYSSCFQVIFHFSSRYAIFYCGASYVLSGRWLQPVDRFPAQANRKRLSSTDMAPGVPSFLAYATFSHLQAAATKSNSSKLIFIRESEVPRSNSIEIASKSSLRVPFHDSIPFIILNTATARLCFIIIYLYF